MPVKRTAASRAKLSRISRSAERTPSRSFQQQVSDPFSQRIGSAGEPVSFLEDRPQPSDVGPVSQLRSEEIARLKTKGRKRKEDISQREIETTSQLTKEEIQRLEEKGTTGIRGVIRKPFVRTGVERPSPRPPREPTVKEKKESLVSFATREGKPKEVIKGRVQAADINPFERFTEEKIKTPLRRAEMKGGIGALPAFVGSAGVAFVETGFVEPVKFGKELLFHPIKTTKALGSGLKEIVTSPTARQQIGLEIGETAKESPGTVAGTVLGIVGSPFIVAKIGRVAAKKGQSLFIKGTAKVTGKAAIPAEKILAKTTPTSKSLEEALRKFGRSADPRGGISVVTAAPQPLKGRVAQAGRKGAVGLEDPGIFVTPTREGASRLFLRLDQKGSFKLSLLPSLPKIPKPTVSVFQAPRGVSSIPGEIISAPGFLEVRSFFGKQPASGTVFITKRSQIGKELILQEFPAKGGEILPIARTIRRNGKVIKLEAGAKLKKGDILREAGTPELEAVIPEGQRFITESGRKSAFEFITGFKDFTLVKGRPVGIQRFKLVDDVAPPTKSITAKPLVEPRRLIKSPRKRRGKRRPISSRAEIEETRVSPTSQILGQVSRPSPLSSRVAFTLSRALGRAPSRLSRTPARAHPSQRAPSRIRTPIGGGISFPSPSGTSFTGGSVRGASGFSGISSGISAISSGITPSKKQISQRETPKPKRIVKKKKRTPITRKFKFTPTLLGIQPSVKKKRKDLILPKQFFTGIEVRVPRR